MSLRSFSLNLLHDVQTTAAAGLGWIARSRFARCSDRFVAPTHATDVYNTNHQRMTATRGRRRHIMLPRSGPMSISQRRSPTHRPWNSKDEQSAVSSPCLHFCTPALTFLAVLDFHKALVATAGPTHRCFRHAYTSTSTRSTTSWQKQRQHAYEKSPRISTRRSLSAWSGEQTTGCQRMVYNDGARLVPFSNEP